jgi:hypothetical protein
MRFAFAIFMVLSSFGGIAWGSVVTRLSPAEVVARADTIVVGTVVSQRYIKDGPRLLTETSVTVEQSLRGATPAGEVFVVTQLGGRLGDREASVVGDVTLRPGERVALLLRSFQGRHYIVGLSLGAYVVHGQLLRQQPSAALLDEAHALGPAPGARELSLSDLVALVAADAGPRSTWPGSNPAVCQ